MPPSCLTKFEIQIFCQNEPKFNNVYSRNRLPNSKLSEVSATKYGTNVINLDEYKSLGTH